MFENQKSGLGVQLLNRFFIVLSVACIEVD
jgi:hypothetical protein